MTTPTPRYLDFSKPLPVHDEETDAFHDEMDRRQRDRAERSSRASSESAHTD